MKIVGYCAERHGYFRESDDESRATGWKKLGVVSVPSPQAPSLPTLPIDRAASVPKSCTPLRFGYKDLRDEEKDESQPKVCGGQLFSKLMQRGHCLNKSPPSLSCTTGNSGSREEIEDEDLNLGEERGTIFFQHYQNIDDLSSASTSFARENHKRVVGQSGLYRPNIPMSLKGIDSMTYSMSDIGMSCSFSKESVSNTMNKEKSHMDWMHYVKGDVATVVIAKLMDDCQHYQSETMALREEIEHMKMELGCLRSSMLGRTHETHKMLV